MKTKYILTVLATAAALGTSCKHEQKEKSALGEPDVIPVKVESLSTLQVPDKISVTGLVSTEDEAKYAFKIGGVINRILIEEGQFFKKGQLLATLNTTEIAAGLAQNSLGVEKAERDYARAVSLYKDSVFTLEQLQNTKTALDVARKSKEATAFNEHYSHIYAAADGFVTKKLANPGEVIGEGMPVLAVNSTDRQNRYELKVGVTDREWPLIRIGQKATITLDGYKDSKFDAVVFRRSQAADPQLGSFEVELKMDLNGVRPAVGMFGKAEIATDGDHDLMVIPYAALVEADGNKGFIFTTVGNNHVKRVAVNIQRFDNNRVYLKEKLRGIDQVVVSNSPYLNEQSIVKVIR